MILALLLSAGAVTGGTSFTDGVLRLIGRFNVAHACPISATEALTNAHVTDLRPFDQSHPPYPYRYSDGVGGAGWVLPLRVARSEDLAILTPVGGRFGRWFRIAEDEPIPGETVNFLGYDWRKRKDAFQERVFQARISRVVAGHIVMDRIGPAGEPGSSGACVFNARGELIAIQAFVFHVDDGHDKAGLAVGVWGRWRPVVEVKE